MVVTVLMVFTGAAQQFPAPLGTETVHAVLAEPLRTNSHVCSVGGANVTNNGSGVGVITELAIPTVGPLDRFNYMPDYEGNLVDPTQFWAAGAAGEALKITYLII
jgi:hypothetical protein